MVVVAAIARRTTDKVPDDIEVISKTNGVSWVVGRVYNSTKDCKFDTEYLRRCTEEAFPSTVGSNSCKLHWHRYRTTWGKMSNKWTLLEKSMDTQVEFSVCSRVSEDYDHLVTYFDTLLQPDGMSIGEVETLTRCYRSLNRVKCIPTMGIVWDSDYPRLTRMAYYAGEVEHWNVEPIRGRKGCLLYTSPRPRD